MSITVDKILAAAPVTSRGQPTQLSVDAKGERIAYASGKSIFLRSIDDPSSCKQYTGHTAATSIARFSPSGFYVASGDVSGTVRVWDAVEAVNTKGDQRIIAVGDGRERFGHCITADSGNSVGEVTGHSKPVNAVSLRQQRPFRAATVSDDGSMCFLHGAPFKFAGKANLHKGFVFGTAFSPDGSTLATVGADRRIQLYDGKTGEPTKNIGEGVHTGSIFAVSWAKDSKRLVTASADQTVRVWDVDSGENTHTWKLGQEGAVNVGDQQVGVAWARDGLIISLNLDGDLNYLEVGSAAPTRTVQGHNKSITAIGAGSDGQGKDVYTGSFDGRICHWDVEKGLATVVDGQTHTNQVTQFISISGQAYSVGWDDTLRIVDESAKTFAGASTKLQAQPKGVGASEGRVVVATAAGIAVYSKDQLVGELSTSYTPTSLASSGPTVAVGDGNDVRIYTLDPSHKLSEVTILKKSTASISTLAFSKDGAYLAAGNSQGKIFAFKSSDWSVAADRWSAHTARVMSIAWNDAGTHAASGALDTHVYVWSLEKPASRVKALNAHKDGVNGVAWVTGSTKVASTGGDASVKIWSVSGLQ
ncbi:WD40 repeat-like protein [Cryphonectria parasitica EP155]|uniref:WD40 repeat-like protein n=1 Tax=Cryphonectria parasitica (strain ATCC 38755 / EP155) TaxID=660469 RepID=A0A9P5CKI4_CRYP1|nr:WD40 repeat-like protein [Cryphonectria parasitica EP155]KAF3760805.1 WD40 repeat-like protein [Cryphonectria parasitica EP155]